MIKPIYGTARRRWEPIVNAETALIPLSQGVWATIDLFDLGVVAPYAWSASVRKHTTYAVTQVGRSSVRMHNLIAPANSGRTDHQDRNGLNNRRSNLRPATRSQNAANSTSGKGNSPFKGVAFHKASGLYHATIVVDGRQLSLKYHPDPEAAARAYDAAAAEHFGQFALTNKELGLL